jgi:Na+/H+ antiporter NhaA
MVVIAIAKAYSNAKAILPPSGTQTDFETLKRIAIFCGIGLVVSLLLAGVGVYLSLAPHIDGLDVMYWI